MYQQASKIKTLGLKSSKNQEILNISKTYKISMSNLLNAYRNMLVLVHLKKLSQLLRLLRSCIFIFLGCFHGNAHKEGVKQQLLQLFVILVNDEANCNF